MSEARRTVSIRLAVKDHEVVTRALRSLGAEGELALKRIEKAGAPATGRLLALNAASREGQQAVQGYAGRLGPMGRILGDIGPAGMVAAAGVTALVGAGVGLVGLALNAANARDALNDMSERAAVSVEHLSTLRLGLQQAGSSLEDFTVGMKGLANSAQAALDPTSRQAQLFKLMGIEVTDTSGKIRPLYDLFLDTADGLNRFGSETERNAAAQDLLGKAYQALIPFIVQGSEKIKEGEEQMRRMGGEISKADALLADQFNDNLQMLGTRAEIAGQKVGGTLLPAMSAIVDVLGEMAEEGIWERLFGEGPKQQERQDRRMLEELSRLVNSGKELGAYGQEWLDQLVTKSAKAQAALVDVDTAEQIQLSTIDKLTEAEKARGEAAKEAAKAEKERAQAKEQADKAFAAWLKKTDVGYVRKVEHGTASPFRLLGEVAAKEMTLGWSQYLQSNQYEVANPADLAAYDAATSFRATFTGILSESYEDLLTGDFENAIKGLGTNTVGFLISGVADELAKETVQSDIGVKTAAIFGKAATESTKAFKGGLSGLWDFLSGSQADAVAGQKSGFLRALDSAIPSEQVGAKGRELGGILAGGYKSGVEAFFLGMTIQQLTGGNLPTSVVVAVSLAQTFTADFAENGGVWKSVHEGTESALRAAAMGATIGKLVGDDITAQKSSITAAFGSVIGGAFGQPAVGGAIGAIIGTALDQFAGGMERTKASGRLREFLTDVQAFGGLQGYVQRTGGFAGLKGDAAQVFGGGDESAKRTVEEMIRLTAGATQEQAAGAMRALYAVGISGTREVIEASVSMQGQIKNVLATLGFSATDINSLVFKQSALDPGISGAPSPALPRTFDLGAGYNPSSKPVVTETPPLVLGNLGADVNLLTPLKIAKDVLTQGLMDGSLSRRVLQQIGAVTLTQAATEMGGFWPTLAPSLRGVIVNSPQDEVFLRSRGIDIRAAQGYDGYVDRPTVFLAGEGGQRERVTVTPEGRGGSDGGAIQVHLHVGTIQTPDVNGMQTWLRGPALDWIKQQIYRDSFTGNFRISERAVIN